MGKIYRALQRSGNVFTEKDVAKRTLNENALTSSEKTALGRSHRNVEQNSSTAIMMSQNLPMLLLRKIDSCLMALGLSKDQISRQDIKELNKSLRQIDGYIADPESFLKQECVDSVDSKTDFKLNVLPILLERRMFVLETYNELVNKMKNHDWGRVIEKISDAKVKSYIEKILNDLQIKNSILKQEYKKIEKLRLNVYSEQQKFSSMLKQSNKIKSKNPEYSRSREPVTTIIMGALLILIAFLIAVASFVKISVPDILNSAFLIILGFFFGQGIGRLASFRETKKAE